MIKGLAKRFLTPHTRLLKSIGDDTSVTLQKAGKALLATTDVLIEGTHFKADYTTPYLLGKKALSISLSDIAAMGGEPLFFLVSVGLKAKTERSFINMLYRGLSARGREYGAALAGGNTAKSPVIMVSTTVFGEAEPDKTVYRSGARPGDSVYVTGYPGDAALGLKALMNHGREALKGPFRSAVKKHLDPAPRVEAGRILASGRIARSMIDVSDGVALDLKRLCEESSVGAVIEVERLPLSPSLRRYTRLTGGTPYELILSGGEDYELLFTASGDSGRVAAVARRLRLPITHIGRIVKGRGIALAGPGGKALRLKKLGFEHF